MKSVKLYIAFPDGVLNYVCAECTALCCHGFGMGGSLRKEMPALIKLYPQIESMATSREGDLISFSTPLNGCVLLEPDNRCGAETRHGKALKPSVCSLFPFNGLTRIGKVVAVTPQFGCPLRITLPPQPGQVHGTHSAVEVAVYDSDLLECTYSHMKPTPLHPSETADAVLKREEKFRDKCSQALLNDSFYSTIKSESKDPQALHEFVCRVAQVMGMDAVRRDTGRDDFDDLLLVLAPSFRINLLRLSYEGILRALLLAELIARRVLSISREPLSLKGAYSILSDKWQLITLLAHGDEPVELAKSMSLKAPEAITPEMTFAFFSALREMQKSKRILESLEKTIPASLLGFERVVLLGYIGSRIDSSILKRPSKSKKSLA